MNKNNTFYYRKYIGNIIDYNKIEHIIITKRSDKQILQKMSNLKELTLGGNFNESLGKSLFNLTKLEELSFGFVYNQPFDDSLSTLTNLKTLHLNEKFTQSLDPLLELKNLESIYISRNYNKKINDNLKNIVKYY